MRRDDLRDALLDANVRAFLRVIREGESSQKETAYRTMYGGGLFEAPPWEHPRKAVTAGKWTSTAAGAYQFLSKTWDGLVKQHGFEDFSPQCQDEAAVALIAGRGALQAVRKGDLKGALAKCAREWASLPGSPYGQPTLSYEQASVVYRAWGGEFEEEDWAGFNPDSLDTEHYGHEVTESTVKEAPMAVPLIPVFTALLPTITSLIPALAQIFKPGSEVAQRNVAAAEVVTKALTEATQTPNLQAALERMSEDPEARAAGNAAVTAPAVWSQLVEVGGGYEAARKAAADPGQIEWWRNPAVLIAILILPLVYIVVSAVVLGLGGQAWSDEVKAMTVTAILTGALGSITGFFLGSSLGSQRKTGMLGK